ncbi:MAG: PilZ domain-containing protein [Pseudobutyrivibrio sp.]|nr:PilZ domain-containing protein [Pseudobutyrivibrio sp.]
MKKETNNKILIEHIKPEDNVSVTALMDNKKVDIPVNVVDISEEEHNELISHFGNHVIPIDTITQVVNGEPLVVSFEGQSSLLQLINVNSKGVYKWEHLKIKKYTFKSGRTIHAISSLVPEGVKYNRRRGVRVNIDSRMEIEQDDTKYMVLVKDLSYCGFSFINLTPAEFDPSRVFLLHIIERDGDKSYLVGKFIGKVLREQPSKEGPTVYGCILHDKHAAALQKYVAMKQMEKLNGKKAYTDLQKTSSSEYWKAEVAEALNSTISENEQ